MIVLHGFIYPMFFRCCCFAKDGGYLFRVWSLRNCFVVDYFVDHFTAIVVYMCILVSHVCVFGSGG